MSDYNFLMESRLSPEQYRVVTELSRASADQGMNLYLVGGAVRDLTFGQQIVRDLDFAVEGSPEKLLRALEKGAAVHRLPPPLRAAAAAGRPLEVEEALHDSRLKSSDVQFAGGVRAEIAMCRSEFYARPGRRPEISAAMIFEDLRRRDFSINAMAVSLHPNSRGLLLDPTNGAADIEKRELRVLNTRSFQEDPLRIFRLLRLGFRLGFKAEERTSTHLAFAIEARAWQRLEPDQQRRELSAILREEHPERVLRLLGERRLLAGLDRKVASSRIAYDRFARVRDVMRHAPNVDPFLLNFHCLVEKFGGGQKRRLARKIIGRGKLLKRALTIEREARRLARALRSARASAPSQVYKLLSGQEPVTLLYILLNYPNAKIQNRIRASLHKYPQVRERIPRAALLALGAKPGRKFEKIIERLFFDSLDGKIKTSQQLVKMFRKLAGLKEPPPPPKPRQAKPEKPAKPTSRTKPAPPVRAVKPVAKPPSKKDRVKKSR